MSGRWEELLPTGVAVDGRRYAVRSDYRAVLDICAALADPELSPQDKGEAALAIFYPDWEEIPAGGWQEALERCFWFVQGGEQPAVRPAPRLMDWKQDLRYIVAPINRVMGREIRAMEYLHWWTFLAAYYEIGDCLFAQIVRIRDKKARGQPLDKEDARWYRENRELVDMHTAYTLQEEELLGRWVK